METNTWIPTIVTREFVHNAGNMLILGDTRDFERMAESVGSVGCIFHTIAAAARVSAFAREDMNNNEDETLCLTCNLFE